MKLLARLALLFTCLTGWLQAKPPIEQRLMGTWEIDVPATENYLRANKVLPEPAIEKMRPKLAALRLAFDETGVVALGADGAPLERAEITIIASTKNKIVFTTLNQSGNKTTTWLTWDEPGFWQETSMFPRYRERFVRSKQEPKPTQGPTHGK